MKIGSPEFLLLLWIVPALIAFFIWAIRRRQQLLTQFAEHHLLATLVQSVDYGRHRLRAGLLVISLALIVFSLAQPRWGYTWETLTRKGVDVMIAVDVSQSMRAQDVDPNRLERAKRELIDLLGMLQGDRIGLVAFAGTAFVQCPLTLDYGAFKMFLDYLDPSLIPVPGTAITEAIQQATASFDDENPNGRALILITDGEDHEGHPLDAAKAAAEAGVTIYVIGVGQEEGAPVPRPDGRGSILDASGNPVISRLDEETLQKIALETGGVYARSTTGDLDLDSIYLQGIRKDITAQDLSSTRQKKWEERFQWPLGLAILLLFIEGWLHRFAPKARIRMKGEAQS